MTASIRIDGPRALVLLQMAVEAKGADYAYEFQEKAFNTPSGPRERTGCWYEVNGAPSCGVGLALSYEGVPVSVLNTMDSLTENGEIAGEYVTSVLEENDIVLTDAAQHVFLTFQTNQDLDATWGEAFDLAKEALR